MSQSKLRKTVTKDFVVLEKKNGCQWMHSLLSSRLYAKLRVILNSPPKVTHLLLFFIMVGAKDTL